MIYATYQKFRYVIPIVFSVCMDIKIRVVKENEELLNISRRWELGSCSGSNNYESNFTYVKHERCCLIESQHTLTCYNEKGSYGWGRSSIEIQGKKYCDDFVGFKVRHLIRINSKYYTVVFKA